MWGRSASSVGPGFISRPVAKSRRGTSHVDSDRSLNCAGVIAKESWWEVPLGMLIDCITNVVNITSEYNVIVISCILFVLVFVTV